MLEKVKAITSKQSSTGHTHTQEVLSSSKKRFMVFEQNPQSGKMKKVRAVAEDSQSYDIFTNVFNDGKAVEFDTQDFWRKSLFDFFVLSRMNVMICDDDVVMVR